MVSWLAFIWLIFCLLLYFSSWSLEVYKTKRGGQRGLVGKGGGDSVGGRVKVFGRWCQLLVVGGFTGMEGLK